MPLPPGKWERLKNGLSIGFWTSTSADLVTYSGNDIDSSLVLVILSLKEDTRLYSSSN